MKIYIAGILISLLFISSCATLKDSYGPSGLSSAQHAYKEGNYEKAVVILEGHLAQGRLAERYDEAQFLLAESYFQLKDYRQAGGLFRGYVEDFPEGRRVKEASEYLGGINAILAKDQKEIAASYKEEEPPEDDAVSVVILNDHSYTLSPVFVGESGIDSYLVVTGIAFNRGGLPAEGLRIQVTVYSFFEKILDVGYANLGRLGPGEKLPFSVKIPYLKNVSMDRYEIKPLWSER